MHFLVIGPGAMGCLFAARLTGAGQLVTLLDYKEDRAQVLRAQGIRLEEEANLEEVPVDVVTGKPAVHPDVAVFCVKATQTREAALSIRPWLDPGTAIMTLQNGLGNLESLKEVLGNRPILGGVTSEAATLLGVGHARHAGRGETIIGPSGPGHDILGRIISAFEDAGFKTRSAPEVEGLIWGKLIVNVGINALTALVRVKNGRLPENRWARELLKRAVHEAEAVARARGVHLPYDGALEKVLSVCRDTADNVSSMLQDVLSRRITEIQYINGAIHREGQALQIPTPVNEVLTSLVLALQESYGETVPGPPPERA